jgi:hypothetical protein
MSIKKRIALFTGLIAVVLIVIFVIKILNDFPDLSQKMKLISLRNPRTNNTFYLKNITRGLNFSVNLISLNNRNEINNRDFCFDSETIFYKFCNDTLLITSPSSYKLPNPNLFQFPIQCKQILDAHDYIKFKNEFKYFGFSIFPKDELVKIEK